MTLYNVTFNIKDKRNILEPSIPDSAGDGENKTIKRVCLTDSIAHCMQAIAVGNRDIRVGATLIIREVSLKNLDKKLLISPRELKERGLVPDALENNEFWYLGKVKFKCITCKIVDFDAEIDLAWTCIPIQSCREIIKKYIPKFPVYRYKITKNLYEAAMQYCNKHQLWDTEDNVWDELAMIPWAQKRSIEDLKLLRVED